MGTERCSKFEINDYVFSANFDSGNLAKVEFVRKYSDEVNTEVNDTAVTPNVEFNLWTRPDCAGTPFENSNKTWFYFSIRGGKPSHVVKLNIMNLNRQAKLFSQGMQPVMRIGSSGKWERIKDRPSYNIDNDNFLVSFVHRGGEDTNLEFYYAFTFPYTYTELQDYLNRLDRRFRKKMFDIKVRSMEENLNLFVDKADTEGMDDDHSAPVVNPNKAEDTESTASSTTPDLLNEIYFYRELLTTSVEKRRIDLITISSYHGIKEKREERIDSLFPEKLRHRCHEFKDKKIIFISSRVHPGETPASFVLNGFLHLLLDRKSSIAATLRKTYVFKIVPFLNPDGVVNGHYRTDTLGYNLNRVYTNPDPEKHPSIYAVRKLLRYYHYGFDKPEVFNKSETSPSSTASESTASPPSGPTTFNVISLKELIKNHLNASLKEGEDSLGLVDNNKKDADEEESLDCRPVVIEECLRSDNDLVVENKQESNIEEGIDKKTPLKTATDKNAKTVNENNKNKSEVGKSTHLKDKSNQQQQKKQSITKKEYKSRSNQPNKTPILSARYRPDLSRNKTFQGLSSLGTDFQNLFSQFEAEEKPDERTNLFLYIDLHGHASKKGVFMYGNYMRHPGQAVECMLLPKLMSMNCHHFHFDACNFSERNMYHKGKRDGLSKEGSGRVAIYKSTGLIKSFTLECNYNTGKCVNILPPRGKETTPRVVNLVPPKYTPAIFEEVGRALGPSILDLSNINPISRLHNSEFRSLQGMRNAMRLEIEKSFTKSQILLKAVKGKLKRMKTVSGDVTRGPQSGTTSMMMEVSKENNNKLYWDNANSGQSSQSDSQQERNLNFLKSSNSGGGKSIKKLAKIPQNLPSTVYGKKENSNRKKGKVLCESGSFSGQKLAESVANKKDLGAAGSSSMVPIKRIKVTQTIPGIFSRSDDSPPTSDEDRKACLSKLAMEEPSCSKSKRPSGIPIFKRGKKGSLVPSSSLTPCAGPSGIKSCLIPIKNIPIRPTNPATSQQPLTAGLMKKAEIGSTVKLKKKRSLKTDANIKRKKRAVWH